MAAAAVVLPSTMCFGTGMGVVARGAAVGAAEAPAKTMVATGSATGKS